MRWQEPRNVIFYGGLRFFVHPLYIMLILCILISIYLRNLPRNLQVDSYEGIRSENATYSRLTFLYTSSILQHCKTTNTFTFIRTSIHLHVIATRTNESIVLFR